MQISIHQQAKLERLWSVATCCIAGFAVVSFLVLLVYAIWPALPAVKSSQHRTLMVHPSSATTLSGPMALRNAEASSTFALCLQEMLVVENQSSRPGTKRGEGLFSLAIRGMEEAYVAREGEPLYLAAVRGEDGGIQSLAFSNEPTGWVMTGQVRSSDSLLIRCELEGEAIEFVLQTAGEGKMIPEADHFSRACSWGKDLFFGKYGGKKFRPLAGKEKVQLFDGKEGYVVHVAPEDFLVFSEGRWKEASGARAEGPLARISGGGGALSFEVWDNAGFRVGSFKAEKKRLLPMRVAEGKLIEGAKLRSARQISCQMGKRRLLLNEGDWVLKTEKGWRKIATLKEIDGVLSHAVKGDLFVVDQIGNDGKLKGSYFDEMRTQVKEMVIPIKEKVQK